MQRAWKTRILSRSRSSAPTAALINHIVTPFAHTGGVTVNEPPLARPSLDSIPGASDTRSESLEHPLSPPSLIPQRGYHTHLCSQHTFVPPPWIRHRESVRLGSTPPSSNISHRFSRHLSSTGPMTPIPMAPVGGQLKVLFCGDEFPAAFDLSADLLHKDPRFSAEWCPREQVPERIRNCHMVVPRMTRLTREILESAQNLRLVIQFGVGLEGVDIPAATDLGIPVARIPSASTGNAASCAEHCIYLLLGLLRQQREMELSVRERRLGTPLGDTLQGKSVLICGYGGIGRELALRLAPFGVHIVGVRRTWNEDRDPGDAKRHVPDPLHEAWGLDRLPLLLPHADAVVLCNQLSHETRGMVNKRFLECCKKGVFIVNIARGGLLEYKAVKESLETGHIGGLGLDVAWHEPFDPQDPILAHPNVTITPHIGGVTVKSYGAMAKIIFRTAESLLSGEPFADIEVVNGEELKSSV